jgi:CRP-like cAMP-binding protein
VAAGPVEILFIPGEAVLAPGALPEAIRLTVFSRLLALLSQENMKKEYRFAILSRKGLRERILTYLTMQSNKRGTADVTIPFSREEMASYLCVNRSALSHELSRMRQEGILEFRKNRFTLLNRMAPHHEQSSI